MPVVFLWICVNTLGGMRTQLTNMLERLRDFLERLGVPEGVSKLSVPLSPAVLEYPTPGGSI